MPIAIVIHGGAGPDSDFIRQHQLDYTQALEKAVQAGYDILEKGGSAMDAVETAVRYMEDNPLFNAGKGAALTESGKVEMCASIMNGENMNCGAVAIVQNVKNPIHLARKILEDTKHIYIGDSAARDFAREINAPMEPDYYFLTEHQLEEVKKKKEESDGSKNKSHGTVGAVACDSKGNVAAATSTGGTANSKNGRIGDSSMIGVGCYANNDTCAASSTGDGEYCIRGVVCYDVSAVMEYKGMSVQEAARYVVHVKNKGIGGDIGLISVDKDGNIAAEFNSERMHRAWKQGDKPIEAYNY